VVYSGISLCSATVYADNAALPTFERQSAVCFCGQSDSCIDHASNTMWDANIVRGILLWLYLVIISLISISIRVNTHCTHTHPLNGPLTGTTQVHRYQKGKANLDLNEACVAVASAGLYASPPHCRQITTPTSHHSVFYRWDALSAAQQTASKHCCLYARKGIEFMCSTSLDNSLEQ